ncbi:hypothetical protein C8R45DRAFT_1216323 [Mycena sanguinolenta]|nr:hypothetical protein C8R45DRAFT_1216323 [Mycena sanguinolenta]
MARLTDAQKAQRRAALASREVLQPSSSQNLTASPENTSCDTQPKTRSKSTISRLTDTVSALQSSLDASAVQILRLKSVISELRTENASRASTITSLQRTTDSLRTELDAAHTEHSTCFSRLSTEHTAFQKARKRVRRLENDKKRAALSKKTDARRHRETVVSLRTQLQNHSLQISSLAAERDALNNQILIHHQQTAAMAETTKKLRKDRKLAKMKADYNRASSSELRVRLKQLTTWNAKSGQMYSMETRRLVLRICKAGVSEEKVKDVILWCAEVFEIQVRNLTLSARTVGRMKKEGGYISLIQIGREIKLTYGFTESSDGTSHRKTNLECRSISAMVPTYASDVDDSDPTTWRPSTRFVEVAPSLRHTAQAQVDGTKLIASKIARAVTNSPSAIAEGLTMEWKEWFRKQLAQMSDHAADQHLKHELTAELKHEILIEDLGAEETCTWTANELMDAILAVSGEEIEAKCGKSAEELTAQERLSIAKEIVDTQLGEDTFDQLSDELQALASFLIFGGCCGHKDTNAFKGGCKAMAAAWLPGEEPVLLANKANSSTIRLGQKDSAAVRAAEEASTRGVVKATALLGSLLRHKDEDKGYQDKYLMFMQENLFDLCGETAVKRFPATSQTRYGSHGRAAAVVAKHHPLLVQLIADICDGKTKAGANHVEESVMKALACPRTMAEVVAAALYSMCVSWPYMQAFRKRDENGMLPNLLDLVDLHRKIPQFCESIAANPSLLLDRNSSASMAQLTLDGAAFHDVNVHLAALTLAPDLPDLPKMVTAMFSGAAETWIRFTPEFAVGGPIDCIPRQIRPKLYLTSTNDHNEGGLGSFRVHIRYHPNSTAGSFSAIERYHRNNTEAFAKKYLTAEELLYVMREVRAEDASGAQAAFRKAVVQELERKAEEHRAKVREAAAKQEKRESDLRAVGIITDRAVINKMKVVDLKKQYDVYKLIVKDPVIIKTTLVSIPRRADKLEAVLAALTRYERSAECALALSSDATVEGDVVMVDVNPDKGGLVDNDEESDEEELYH